MTDIECRFPGVSWKSREAKYRVRIVRDKIPHELGLFRTLREANSVALDFASAYERDNPPDSTGRSCTDCGNYLPYSEFYRDRNRLASKCKSCITARSRSWAEANPDRQRQLAREHARRVSRDSPHIGWESRYRVRAEAYGHPVVVESFTLQDLLERHSLDRWECAACGSTEGVELDHEVPVRFAGDHSLSNCRPLCRGCNIDAYYDYKREVFSVA